jgi:hypothetical protein
MSTDEETLGRIKALVDEEHDLRRRRERDEISGDDEHQRLHDIEVELDRCWDLLRQRRALKETGGNPDDAAVRPAGEVEGYLG